jgi:hypothetical protein
MNVIVCAYRQWALGVLNTVRVHPKVSHMLHVTDNEQLYAALRSYIDFDLVIFCGWSTPPDEWATKIIPMVSEHPASSDRYSPGTPLQNQILDGLTHTKHRIVKVGYPELSPRQWSHEIDMSLEGNMDDVLVRMRDTSCTLFHTLLNEWPNVTWNTWEELSKEEQVSRRSPDMSRLMTKDLIKLTSIQLYDRIRCLESPYPNAFIEDEHGKLYFNKVSYEKK